MKITSKNIFATDVFTWDVNWTFMWSRQKHVTFYSLEIPYKS